MIDIDIPDFLKVANRDKPFKGKKRSVAAKAAAPHLPEGQKEFEQLSEPLQAYVSDAIKAGTFQLHWLTDPGTFDLIVARQREADERRAAAKAVWQANAQAGKARLEEWRATKPKFGANVYIKTIKPNPRIKGSKAFERYAEMMKWMKKNPRGTVAELLEAQAAVEADKQYRLVDYKADVDRGNITVDVK